MFDFNIIFNFIKEMYKLNSFINQHKIIKILTQSTNILLSITTKMI